MVAVPVALLAAMIPVLAFGVTPRVDRAADVHLTAVRGDQFQATATLPPPPGCRRVVVIGDSLMDNARPYLHTELEAAGFDHHVDAQPSRRTSSAWDEPYSGVKAALRVRATWGEADCWVIALGSNDLYQSGYSTASAEAAIDEMLSVVTPDSSVWWMNVDFHHYPSWNIDLPARTHTFNAAVAVRVAADPRVQLIDWYALAQANLHWFFDPVHVNEAGSRARAAQVAAALPRSG